MTECQRCGANRANNAFLCFRCEKHAKRLLLELPWWLDRLTEAAVGQTRMSDNGGRKSARRKDLDGEKTLAECIEPFPDPNEDDLERARKAREKAALAHALAAGGVNARASELLAEIADALRYWIKVLCEARNATYTPHRATNVHSLGSSEALWLAGNVAAISASDDAAEIIGDIETHHDEIVRVVNRPVRVMNLGPCPTFDERKNQACGVTLRATQDSIEVHCPRCKRTHNCNRLLLERMDEAERTKLTFEEVLRVNLDQPIEWQIAPRTLRHWRSSGALRAHQWRRADGRLGLTRHDDDDVPLYLWADVKRLQLRKPQKAATGAAAHGTSA